MALMVKATVALDLAAAVDMAALLVPGMVTLHDIFHHQLNLNCTLCLFQRYNVMGS